MRELGGRLSSSLGFGAESAGGIRDHRIGCSITVRGRAQQLHGRRRELRLREKDQGDPTCMTMAGDGKEKCVQSCDLFLLKVWTFVRRRYDEAAA